MRGDLCYRIKYKLVARKGYYLLGFGLISDDKLQNNVTLKKYGTSYTYFTGKGKAETYCQSNKVSTEIPNGDTGATFEFVYDASIGSLSVSVNDANSVELFGDIFQKNYKWAVALLNKSDEVKILSLSSEKVQLVRYLFVYHTYSSLYTIYDMVI